ncbi:glycosyltransferase family 2 protein [Actibacterium ureilyticum]|uniref:glycosyltransferase family 2 protein n=1 Tax=Actibacterium ureilyticum TaxID=1590614 RepID=UPI000BAAEC35|nr:glycosyltransferase family 2 protein [Actibacterium ureilyticum]
MTKFSVVIPALNAEKTLTQTLRGVQVQTCRDWEAIVVDDGSTDGTVALARRFARADHRIRVVPNPGKGPSAARNFGAIDCASGTYVAFCDADDVWAPGKLTSVAQRFAEGEVEAVFGQIGFFQNQPHKIRTRSTVPEGEISIRMLLGENPVCTLSNLTVARAVFEATGGFDADLLHNEDLDWQIRLIGQGYRLCGVNHLHVCYRTSGSGLSSDLTAMIAARDRALLTAQSFGVTVRPAEEALHYRYLARRALRLNLAPRIAWDMTRRGLSRDARSFLCPPRRGAATALGALLAQVLPAAVRRSLFSH